MGSGSHTRRDHLTRTHSLRLNPGAFIFDLNDNDYAVESKCRRLLNQGALPAQGSIELSVPIVDRRAVGLAVLAAVRDDEVEISYLFGGQGLIEKKSVDRSDRQQVHHSADTPEMGRWPTTRRWSLNVIEKNGWIPVV